MKGAVIVNGFYYDEAYNHQVKRIIEEFAIRNIELSLIKNNEAILTNIDINLDFAIFLDKDIYLARILEQKGVVVFNNSFAIEKCDDKILTAISLARFEDVFLPKTVIAPLKYTQILDNDFIDQTEKLLGYPMVAKNAKGSLGKGVQLINNREELERKEKELSNIPHLYQVFVKESQGKSVRAYVVGNKYIAGMLLTNDNDFRSNQEFSIAEEVELDEDYIKSAENISKYLDLDFCAVDFFVGAPLVIEVNSNAFFKKLEQISNVNVAGEIADYVIDFLKEIKNNG